MFRMKSCARALRAACSTRDRLRVGLPVGDVVVHRVVEENRLLRHLRHLAAQRSQRQIAHIVAVNQNAPEVTSKNRGIRFTSVDLPAPLGPDDGQHFAGIHLKVHIVKNLLLALAGRVGEAHVLEFDGLAKAREGGARGRSLTSSSASKKEKIDADAPMAC
jgi:hypothetical protein